MSSALSSLIFVWFLFGIHTASATVTPQTLCVLDEPILALVPNKLASSLEAPLSFIWKKSGHPTLRELVRTPRSVIYFAGQDRIGFLADDDLRIPGWAIQLQQWLADLGLSLAMSTADISRLAIHPEAIHLQGLKQIKFRDKTIQALQRLGIVTVFDIVKYFASEEGFSAFLDEHHVGNSEDLRLFDKIKSLYQSEQDNLTLIEQQKFQEFARRLGQLVLDEEGWNMLGSLTTISDLERLELQGLWDLQCGSVFR